MSKRVLSPGREARLALAIYAAIDARGGDPDRHRRLCAEVVDLHWRLHAEQAAERGLMPEDLAGCVAVLHVAARILDVYVDALA